MKVAKITLWDGYVIYTDNLDNQYISHILKNAHKYYLKNNIKRNHVGQVDVIDIDRNEYNIIPATIFSNNLV